MSTKTKNKQTSIDKLTYVAQQAGVVIMTAAVTLGMVEMAEQINSKVVIPTQTAFAVETNVPHGGGLENSPLRREREETAPHYINYSVTQRTPARSAKF
ncbi:MAG: hypothetical protein AAB971_04280 [Patescibacteria group bacterium]